MDKVHLQPVCSHKRLEITYMIISRALTQAWFISTMEYYTASK